MKTIAGNKAARDPLLGTFATRRSEPRKTVITLKKERTYTQARQIINSIRYLGLDTHLYGQPSVTRWNEVLLPPRIPHSADWVQEFGWLVHGFCAGKDRLKLFLAQRKQFGAAYLLGDYPLAEEILNQVEAHHGLSLWLAERKFMLLQAKEGFESHKKYLSNIQNSADDSIVSYILTMTSTRLEPHVAYEAFCASTQTMLRDLLNEKLETLASVIEFQLLPWSFGWAKDGHAMLWACRNRPLIDRYDKAIKIVASLSVAPLDEKQKRQLRAMLSDLHEAIDDRQASHLLFICDTDSKWNPDEKSKRCLDALDLFVKGEYAKAAIAAEMLLKEDPTSFDFYWLLARSIACSGQAYNAGIDKASISWQIVENLITIAENTGDLLVPTNSLKTIALKLGDNHLGVSLWQFAEHRISGELSVQACHEASIRNKIDSPDIGMSFDRALNQKKAAILNDIYPNQLCLRLALYEGGEYSEDIKSKVSPIALAVFEAEAAASRNDANSVLLSIKPFLDGVLGTLAERNFYMADIAEKEFDSLVYLERTEEACASIVKYYLKNKNILKAIRLGKLVEDVNCGKYPQLKNTLFWPILLYLSGADEQTIYEAVDDLMIAKGCSSPLDLIKENVSQDPLAQRVVLRDVLVPSVIARGALWCKTAAERRLLRKNVLQSLFALCVDDQEFVVREMSLLDQGNLLEMAFRNVEGPKFILDFTDIDRELKSVLDAPARRYLEYKTYEEGGGLLANDEVLLELAKTGTPTNSAPELKIDQSDILLSKLVAAVVIHYLWDTNRGLNAALSTRIRHGALENQFKRVFDAHGMLAIRTAEGQLRLDNRLSEKLSGCKDEVRKDIEAAYFSFSEKLSEIYQGLMANLRIRVPAGFLALVEQAGIPVREIATDHGLIDFNEILSTATVNRLKSENFDSAEAFLFEMRGIFSEQTSKALSSVRSHLDFEVNRVVGAAIQELDARVSDKTDDDALRIGLRSEISAAKDEFAQDLQLIQNWFAVAERVETYPGSLKLLADSAWRIVHFASNGKLGRSTMENFEDIELTQDRAINLYEVLCMLFRNVVQHSGVQNGQVVSINHRMEDGKGILTVSNLVDSLSAAKSCIVDTSNAVSCVDNTRALHRQSGGSGMGRIRALLLQSGSKDVVINMQQDQSTARFICEITY